MLEDIAEKPPGLPGKESRMNIDDLLRIATERRASDLHLKVGNYPHLRIDGELVPLTDQPRISAEDMLNMAFSMMSARQKQKFKETTEIDMAYGVAGLGRFRVNIFQQRGNVGLVPRWMNYSCPRWSSRFATCLAAWCSSPASRGPVSQRLWLRWSTA
jgi:Tfp pilus assembly pilus retraction ATPase PilT